MLDGAAQLKPKLGADSLWSRAPRPELLPRAPAKMRAAQRSLDLVVLDAEGLAAAVMFQFESWDKKNYEATDIIVSTHSGFSKSFPKMVFHIWGKYT